MPTTDKKHIVFSLLVSVLLSVTSCSGAFFTEDIEEETQEPEIDEPSPPPTDSGKADNVDKEAPSAEPTFRFCASGTLPAGLQSTSWKNQVNDWITQIGNPLHSGLDTITTPQRSASIEAKFSYGIVSKDLEGETIQIWLDDCSRTLRKIGVATTNDDGRIEFELPSSRLPSIGAYKLYFRVPGDDSSTTAMLRIVPEETKFIVFDIDETLSAEPSTGTLRDVVSDGYDEAKRRGSVGATNIRRFKQNYQIIYLTARPYLLTEHTRNWLTSHGFAPGTLHLIQDVENMVPANSGAGDYKYPFLKRVQSNSVNIDWAYGNALTDIYAYKQIGLPGRKIFTLGKHGGKQNTVDLGSDYLKHLNTLQNKKAVDQPYTPITAN